MISLINFPLKKQETPYTCGYTTLAANLSFLEQSIAEKEVARKSHFQIINKIAGFFSPAIEARGIPAFHFVALFNKLSVDYQIKLMPINNQTTVLKTIEEQLINNLPLPIIYATTFDFNKTKAILHYSTIIGFDQAYNKIALADPFGYEKNLSIDKFFNQFSFQNYHNMPLIVKLMIKLGLIKKNSLFIIKRK